MTSQKQIEANRRNALLSTGPRTEEGKQTSRQNALKHGLTAETVIVGIEDTAAYAAFEQQILAENDPQSALEHELALRIASLLWRLRRATLIETGLLERFCKPSTDECHATNTSHLDFVQLNVRLLAKRTSLHTQCETAQINDGMETSEEGSRVPAGKTAQQQLTHSFLRLTDEVPTAPLDRITRYEAALWRQFVQAVFALDAAKRQQFVASRYRFRPYPPQW